jgi:hypothetical protein
VRLRRRLVPQGGGARGKREWKCALRHLCLAVRVCADRVDRVVVAGLPAVPIVAACVEGGAAVVQSTSLEKKSSPFVSWNELQRTSGSRK